MKNIVLINPRGQGDSPNQRELGRVPLGLLAVGSFLQQQGYRVDIVDTRIYDDDTVFKKLTGLLGSSRLNNVGLTVMTGQIPHALRLCRFIREVSPDTPIVWGGVHGTLFPEQTSAHSLVDFVVTGPGERPYLSLAEQLSKEDREVGEIEGVAVNGRLVPRKYTRDYRIEELPALNYDLLDLPRYMGPAPHFLLSPHKPVRVLEVLSSRGCPWRCSFCINVVTGHRWQGLSAEQVLDELERLVAKYQLDGVRFLDEDLFVDRSRVLAIVDGILNRHLNITWGANARANYFNDNHINLPFAQRLYASGMRIVSIGAESGSERVLQLLKKDITTRDLLRSAEICRMAGLRPVYSWMVGMPTETRAEMKATIDLMSKITKVCPSAKHSALWLFRPYPGGELYQQCTSLGLRQPQSLEEWEGKSGVADPSTGFLNIEELTWIKDREFVKFLSTYYFSLGIPLTVAAKRGLRGFTIAMLMKPAFVFDNYPLIRRITLGAYGLLRNTYRLLRDGE